MLLHCKESVWILLEKNAKITSGEKMNYIFFLSDKSDKMFNKNV